MRRWLYPLFLGIILGACGILLYPHLRPRAQVVPPWHPFLLRSDLTLADLVADGYRLHSMPCGMPQFGKSIGDTLIYYYVDVDCNSYEGRYDPYEQLLTVEEEQVIPASDPAPLREAEPYPSQNIRSIWEQESAVNPYYPFEGPMEKCHQEILWRYYGFTMIEPDRDWIESFIYSKGMYFYDRSVDWESDAPKIINVNGPQKGMSHECYLSLDEWTMCWEFRIISTIPVIDHEREADLQEHERRRAEYYRSY